MPAAAERQRWAAKPGARRSAPYCSSAELDVWFRLPAVLMATLLEPLYVALFAVALPLWGYLVSWPAFDRQLEADPAEQQALVPLETTC